MMPEAAVTKRIGAALAFVEPYNRVIALTAAIALSAALTYAAWDLSHDAVEQEAKTRFEFHASQIDAAIRGRMIDYEQVLRGGVGLFAASRSVERDEWRAYVQHLRIERFYRGIQGLGFALRVPAEEKKRHESAVRAEGFPDYAVTPEGERQEYVPIVFLEPFSGSNLRAFGYDMFSEAVRRAAMERARNSGDSAVSGKVTLVQDTGRDAQAGLLMYVPVYRHAAATDTVEQRRAALTGFVYGVFRMNDLMRGILGEIKGVRLQIFDGAADASSELLYDGNPADRAGGHEPAYVVTENVRFGGRVWTMRMSSLPAYEATIDRRTPRFVAGATGVISALILAIIWSLVMMRANAVRLARSMTRDLRLNRERLALAIDGSGQALFDWNVATGNVVLSEHWSRITGGGLGSVATTIEELQARVHPEDLQEVIEKTADLVTGRLVNYHVEHRVRTASDEWRWISSRARVVERDAGGRAMRIAGTNMDITERKEIERLKNEFIATVSHELRTPLAAIVGALGLLREVGRDSLSAEGAKFLEMAEHNSDRLAALINDILDIEKIESGRMDFRASALQVRPLLERAVKLNDPYAEKYGVRYLLSEPVPGATFTADEDRVLQVMTNLMSNAAKFSPRGQVVSIGAAVRDGMMRISVTDRGAGIPISFQERIFSRFSQADSSDSRGKGGTGLGLAICKALVEKMGGTIGFDSELGKGTTFHFELPLAK